MQSARKSLFPAQILETSVPQMKDKGRIRVGAQADIVVFDPEKVRDRATYEKPAQPSVGFQYALVNGQAVVSRPTRSDSDARQANSRAVAPE